MHAGVVWAVGLEVGLAVTRQLALMAVLALRVLHLWLPLVLHPGCGEALRSARQQYPPLQDLPSPSPQLLLLFPALAMELQ